MTRASERTRTRTLTVPSTSVERRPGRDGGWFYVVRLPEGTSVSGQDLSSGLVCAVSARSSRGLRGMTDVEIADDGARTVRLPPHGVEGGATASASAEDICRAASEALYAERDLDLARQAVRLLEAGKRDRAHEVMAGILEGGQTMLPPANPAPAPAEAPGGHTSRAYEDMGVLPAFLPLCAVDTHSPTASVPDEFAYVAIDPGRCVPRGYFESVLSQARAREQRYGGALEEHSIGYAARQLARPFAVAQGRHVAEVNGACVDATSQVMDLPGAPDTRAPREGPRPDAVDLGVASLTVDRRELVERLGMSGDEADATVAWLQDRVQTDAAIAAGRVGMAHVSALLRSPDAAETLALGGARLENPATGERVRLEPDGSLSCTVAGIDAGSMADAGLGELLGWLCIHVASDDSWRVAPADAYALAFDERGPMAELRERATRAYRADAWLSPAARMRHVPTRERTDRLLREREDPARGGTGYRLRDACREVSIPVARAEGTRARDGQAILA